MDTFQLFWFFLWRMTLWGLIFGLVLSVPWAGSAGTAEVYVGENTLHLGLFADEPVLFSEALSLGFSWPLVIGYILGPPAGTLVGSVDGVVLCFLTALHHNPPQNLRRYRRSAGMLCAVASLIPFLWPFRHTMIDDTLSLGQVWLYLAVDVAYPSLLAMVVMWWAGRRVAGQWYRRVSLVPSDE